MKSKGTFFLDPDNKKWQGHARPPSSWLTWPEAFGILALIVFNAIPIAVFVSTLQKWLEVRPFELEGREVQARVVAVRQEWGRDEDDGGQPWGHYSIRYRLELPGDDQGYEREGFLEAPRAAPKQPAKGDEKGAARDWRPFLTAQELDELKPGSPIKVIYLPSDPACSFFPPELESRRNNVQWASMCVFGPMGGLLLFLMGACLWQRWRRRRRELNGTVLPGRVVSSSAAPVAEDDAFKLHLEYEFSSPTGETRTGSSERTRTDLKEGPWPVPGTPVLVLYLGEKDHEVL
jgi:hypothetical protein